MLVRMLPAHPPVGAPAVVEDQIPAHQQSAGVRRDAARVAERRLDRHPAVEDALVVVLDHELEPLRSGGLESVDVVLGGEIVDLGVGSELLPVVANPARVGHVGDASARLIGVGGLEQQGGDLAIDQRLVPLDLQLDDVGLEDVVGSEVRERHLVVDSDAPEADLGVVEPVTHAPGDLVLDRVPHGAPLHGAHRPLGPVLAEEGLR
jgi:hypothetical protein